jgi:poly(3-hydroxybutyrate) depolymerase
MLTKATSMMGRMPAVLVGGFFLCLLFACTNQKVAIGQQYKDGPGLDGSTTGTTGCDGNLKPPTSPSKGYLTIDVNGSQREYSLELPTDYDGTTPVPVLFAFHGTESNAQQFLESNYGNIRAGTAGRVLLVGPNGLSRNGETGWVDFSSNVNNGVTQVDIDFFDALVAHLRSNYCIDVGRVFAMGHAAGAMIANQLSCLRSDVLRGVGSFSGDGPDEDPGVACTGKVAAFIGHNPKEGDAAECAKLSSGSCPWVLLWANTGWPTTQFWTKKDGCADPGSMPTAAFEGNSSTGNPLPCKSFAGCDANYPVTLCLYDYWDQWDGPHAFPSPWGAKAVTDFFLALPQTQ